MKRLICMLLVLLLAASSAMAATFEEGVETMLGYVRKQLDASGVPFHFTQYDRAANQQLGKAQGYDFYSRTNAEKDTYCTVLGHDASMEIFTAATGNSAYYEDMVLSALYVVQFVYGECEQSTVDWAFGKLSVVTAKSDKDAAYMYTLPDGTFLYMERWHEDNAAGRPQYSIGVVFPCSSRCTFTELVSTMKQLAQVDDAAAKASTGAECRDCDGTGSAGVQRVQCDDCGGVGRDGICTSCGGDPLCKVCDGAGTVAQYNYVFGYTTYVKCGACGRTGGCRACDGTGLKECKTCNTLGEVLVSIDCKSCDGNGRK